jgi:hypothetical protein
MVQTFLRIKCLTKTIVHLDCLSKEDCVGFAASELFFYFLPQLTVLKYGEKCVLHKTLCSILQITLLSLLKETFLPF